MTETKVQRECPYCHGGERNKCEVYDSTLRKNITYKVGSDSFIDENTITGSARLYVGIDGYIILDAGEDVYNVVEEAVACPMCGRKLGQDND